MTPDILALLVYKEVVTIEELKAVHDGDPSNEKIIEDVERVLEIIKQRINERKSN